MADNIILLHRQIRHDIKNGIIRRYKVYLLFMILLSAILVFFYKRVGLNMNAKPSLYDCLIYIFAGKEEILNLTNKDIFDIPIAWLFIHMYMLFGIVTYPKTEFTDRGCQFLIRAGNKWCWWLGKCVYIALSVILYCFCIIFTGLLFTALNGGSYMEINEEICARVLGLDIVNISGEKFYLCILIMPVLLFMVLGFTGMFISFLQNNIVAIIVLLGYISVSAYWCNIFLLGNYTMLLRVHKMSLSIGIVLSVIIILFSGTLGYKYFNSLDIYGREQEEM